MIQRIYIKNFTLIDELDMEFHPGFSVITGETGAGKSIILGAIGLLLGNRADTKQIKSGKDKCVIEAHFNLSRYDMKVFFDSADIDYEPEDTILRRELTAAGKSRAFINDTPVALTTMRELGQQLVDIHSQHQNLLLQKEDFQLEVIDILAADKKELEKYGVAYRQLKDTMKALDNLKAEIAASRDNEDFMRFQYNELLQASLDSCNQEELEQTAETLSHSEEIKSALYMANTLLNEEDNGVVERIRNTQQAMAQIAEVFPKAKEIAERLESAHIEMKDIAEEVEANIDHVDFDPQELDRINAQLDRLYALEQKYHVSTVSELIDISNDLKQKLDSIDNSDEELDALTQAVEVKRKECEKLAAALSDIRRKRAKKMETEMTERLIPLGMPHVKFEVEITTKPLAADGYDKVNFLFSANTSTPPRPVSQIASGGEIARVMLSLKAMISGAVKLPTIIFDEIDTGVSGKIAEKMAEIMQEMGHTDRQVISITHLPQIAALGTTHYRVSKEETAEGTVSHMTMLSNEERVREIAQMLSGSDISEAALANAGELLKLSKQ